MYFGKFPIKEFIPFWTFLSLALLLEIHVSEMKYLAVFSLLLPIILLRYSPSKNKKLSVFIAFLAIIAIGSYTFIKARPFLKWRGDYYGDQSQIGFNKISDLNSFQSLFSNEENDKPELRIIGEEAPVFFAASAQDTYIKGRWYTKAKAQSVKPIGSRGNHFNFVHDIGLEKTKSWHVYPQYTDDQDWIFTPNSYYQLAVQGDSLIEVNGRYSQPHNQNKDDYILIQKGNDSLKSFFSKSRIPWELLEIFPKFDSDISTKSITKKLDSIFITDYTYSLQIEKPKKEIDPLVYFNRTKKGYCEYFASTGVALLQANNRPARLLKGYAYPIKESEDQWLYTSKKAHAWVEYLDEQGDWVNWDPTPPSFFPAEQYQDNLKAKLDRLLFKIKLIFSSSSTKNLSHYIEVILVFKNLLFLIPVPILLLLLRLRKPWNRKVKYIDSLLNKYNLEKKNEPLLHSIERLIQLNEKEAQKVQAIKLEYLKKRFKS